MNASTPRILQSADEAPCGSLCQTLEGVWKERLVMHMHNHRGWNMGKSAKAPVENGWHWPQASNGPDGDFPARLIAEGLTEAECHHLSGLSAADAIAWCEARDKAAKRPQPGDVVPWAEVEDGALYAVGSGDTARFRMVLHGTTGCMCGPEDYGIAAMLQGRYVGTTGADLATTPHYPAAIFVARDLGSDPEAWRRAMREWTASGNKPATPVTPLAAAVADIDATAEVSESAAWAKVKAAVTEREDAFVRRGYMLDNLRASLATAHKERDEARMALRDERTRPILQAQIEFLEGNLDTLRGHLRGAGAGLTRAQKERDEARAGWAEQSADAARLRLALEKAQQQIVQAHEDIDALIAKQTAADFDIAALKQDRAWAQESHELERVLAAGGALLAQHHARIVGRLLDEMARGYFVDRLLDPNLYADAMKAAGREVKP